MTTDLERFAKRYGVPFKHNPHFPINTLLLMRGATAHPDCSSRSASRPTSTRSTTRCGSSRATSTIPPTVGAVLQAAGFDPAATARGRGPAGGQGPPEGRDAGGRGARRVRRAHHVRRAATMFWGQDRLDFVREALGRLNPSSSSFHRTQAMSDILVHTEAGVMTITFNRVDKKNSITSAMYAELADALAKAEGDAAVRCVLIQGDPTIFSAGNDIGDFLNAPPATQGLAGVPLPARHRDLPEADRRGGLRPGRGHRHHDAVPLRPGLRGRQRGLLDALRRTSACAPRPASSLLVPQMLGYHRAAEALLLGEPFMAEAALEVGLVNRVVPPTEANAIAQTQARKLAAKPLSALIETKRLLKKAQLPAVIERMDEEGASFGRMLREPAAREAFGAFMEKRKPDFSKL